MDHGLLLICFDINSIHDENNPSQNNNTDQLLESPIRILDDFFSNHKMLKTEKSKINASETKYIFSPNFLENSYFQIISVNNLSFVHEISLDADAYLIFINLEDEKTEEKLEYLIHYIVESCCAIEIKTYIVGMYKNKILSGLNNKELETYFNDNSLNYEYYTIKFTNNEKEHNCLYDIVNKNNINDKNTPMKENGPHKLTEIIEKVMINMYEIKMGVEYNPFKNKFVKKSTKGYNDADSKCDIF